jgi:hypothetical protein
MMTDELTQLTADSTGLMSDECDVRTLITDSDLWGASFSKNAGVAA